jgi:hypothetical protein
VCVVLGAGELDEWRYGINVILHTLQATGARGDRWPVLATEAGAGGKSTERSRCWLYRVARCTLHGANTTQYTNAHGTSPQLSPQSQQPIVPRTWGAPVYLYTLGTSLAARLACLGCLQGLGQALNFQRPSKPRAAESREPRATWELGAGTGNWEPGFAVAQARPKSQVPSWRPSPGPSCRVDRGLQMLWPA